MYREAAGRQRRICAFAVLSPKALWDWDPSSSQLILGAVVLAVQAAVTVGTVAALSEVVAVLAIVTVIDTEFFNGYLINAIGNMFSELSDVSVINSAEADETILQTATSNSGATLAGDVASLGSDLQNLDGCLTQAIQTRRALKQTMTNRRSVTIRRLLLRPTALQR